MVGFLSLLHRRDRQVRGSQPHLRSSCGLLSALFLLPTFPTCPRSLLNWTFTGCFFLTCLFVLPGASLDVTEALSSRKYAAFPEYQARVSRFFPWFPAQGVAQM